MAEKTEKAAEIKTVTVKINAEKLLPGASFTHPTLTKKDKTDGKEYKLTIGEEAVTVPLDDFIHEKLYITKELVEA